MDDHVGFQASHDANGLYAEKTAELVGQASLKVPFFNFRSCCPFFLFIVLFLLPLDYLQKQ